MNVVTVKVILNTDHLVFRDLRFSENHSLEDLHFALLNAFDFEGKQMASFLKTNDDWQAEAEYSLESLSDDDESHVMKNIKATDVLAKPADQLTYIYDYMNEWRFEVEVISTEDGKALEAIEVVNKHGKAPKEDERELKADNAESILMNAILGDEFDEENDDDDLFSDEGFESLDDYDEFQ